jgi:hypothetical protein
MYNITQKKLFFNEILLIVVYTWFVVVFSIYLRFSMTWQVGECVMLMTVSILDDSNENQLYDSWSGSDYEKFDANPSESESGTSDGGSESHKGL